MTCLMACSFNQWLWGVLDVGLLTGGASIERRAGADVMWRR